MSSQSTQCQDKSFGLTPKDQALTNQKVNQISSNNNIVACKGDFGLITAIEENVDTATITNATITNLNLLNPIPEFNPPQLVLGYSGNLQSGGNGNSAFPSYLYYASSINIPFPANPANTMPLTGLPFPLTGIVVKNVGGFVEDFTLTAGNGSATQGAPGWHVPFPGVYRIDAMVTIGGTVDFNNPAGAGFLGIGSPLDGTLSFCIDNSGFLNTNLASTRVDYNTNTIPTGTSITVSYPMFGTTYVYLTPSNFLFIGMVTFNSNQALSLSNATATVTYVAEEFP